MPVIRVSITPSEAARLLDGCFGLNKVLELRSGSPGGLEAILMLVERMYLRNTSRVRLSVLIDNLSGDTAVQYASSGSAPGIGPGRILGTDWGASADLERCLRECIQEYMIQ